MEDENGLELSLSLAWCQSSSKSKDIGDNSSDTRTEEGDRSSKLINDFKHFLEGGTGKLESGTGSQRSDLAKPDERGLWISNDNKRSEVDEEKGPEASNKRKMSFDDIRNQKKHERESHNSDLQERSRQSHVSINTDDGSTAENEDVADSEVVGSSSRMISHLENGGKKYIRGVGPSEVPKEVYTVIDSSAVDVSGQRGFTITSEKEFKVANMPYSVSFPTQSTNIMNVPYSFSAMEQAGGPSVMPGNVPVMFGYSPVQLPVLDKHNSRSLVSYSQQVHPLYAGRFPLNLDKQNEGLKVSQAAMPVILQKASEAPQYNGTALETAKTEGKQHAKDSGSSSSLTVDGVKGNVTIFGSKDESDKPGSEGFPSELSAIRPGIASDVKFGGCGSYPNLPWVSTKGTGPNGRTISGVTYRFSPTQIKIVCACHGSHMSPEEFVRHASEEQTNPGSGSGLASLPGSNTAASAQS